MLATPSPEECAAGEPMANALPAIRTHLLRHASGRRA